MMFSEDLNELMSNTLKANITVSKRGPNDYRVNLPFYFADGDIPKVILASEGNDSWSLTDEAHTFMYLSYHDIDVEDSPTREAILKKILSSHLIEEREGRIVMNNIATEDIGNALFTFTQALLKISDFALWKRERIKSMFIENFRSVLSKSVGGRECLFNHIYRDIDPSGAYPVDCLVKGRHGTDVHVYAVNSDIKASNSALSMYYYNQHKMTIPSCVVFDADISLGKKTFTRVSDVADKTLSSLEAIEPHMVVFLNKMDKAS